MATTALRQRMLEDLQLRGLSARTQECYTRGVRQLAQYYRKSPDHRHPSMNRDRSCGVGTRQLSRFPNQRYRFRATRS